MKDVPALPAREKRNLSELEPELGVRLRRLDEPVAWDDWSDVVSRVRRRQLLRAGWLVVALLAFCGFAFVAAGVLVSVWGVGHSAAARSRRGVTTENHRLRHLVLYSKDGRAQYVNSADNRTDGRQLRWLDAFGARVPVTEGRRGLPSSGDESMVQFSLYSSPSMKDRAGVGVLVCRYGADRNAMCKASFQLSNGGSLSASGMIAKGTATYRLALTGGSGALVADAGEVSGSTAGGHLHMLRFRFV